MRIFFILLPFIWTACQSVQQVGEKDPEASSPVLFTVGDSTIHAEEFIYVYRKNNAQLDSAFTRPDVEEYLGLYEDFKVKIMEAYARGYDTLDSYKDELATYTQQLKEPYLTEKRITEELIDEAFQRTREEIRASHILIRFPENPTPQDTIDAYNEIKRIRVLAEEGWSFDSLAVLYSQDPSAKTNQGDLGYFTSMQMVYPFETAAYQTNVNDISPVIRTRFGYHILKVADRRPANGKVVVAHIMLRHKPDSAAVEKEIVGIRAELREGADWNQLVEAYSEDVNSKKRNGVINPFGIGQAPLPFQEAAFGLENPGDISEPVETQFGWHIIKLIEKRPLPELEDLRTSIERRISQDERADLGRAFLVERLKSEWDFRENPDARKLIAGAADSTVSLYEDDTYLFSIGEKQIMVSDFNAYLDSVNIGQENISGIYEEFVSEEIISWEEKHLEVKYPEYRMLLREYREGILYFELMEEEIWNRASEDSVGQRMYYEKHRDKYRGAPNASATVYAMPDSASARVLEKAILQGEDLDKHLKELAYSDVSPILPVDVFWEEGDQSPWQSIPQEIGVYRKNIMNKWYVVDVVSVNEDGIRPFSKCRGQVISDYQKDLEQSWVKKLKEKYPVKRNEKGVAYIYEVLVQ